MSLGRGPALLMLFVILTMSIVTTPTNLATAHTTPANNAPDGSPPVSDAGGSLPTDRRVATFAVRALAHAGLTDPLGHFNDYKILHDTSPARWEAYFETYTCAPDVCDRHPEGNSSVFVVADGSRLRVEKIEGPVSEQQRAEPRSL